MQIWTEDSFLHLQVVDFSPHSNRFTYFNIEDIAHSLGKEVTSFGTYRYCMMCSFLAFLQMGCWKSPLAQIFTPQALLQNIHHESLLPVLAKQVWFACATNTQYIRKAKIQCVYFSFWLYDQIILDPCAWVLPELTQVVFCCSLCLASIWRLLYVLSGFQLNFLYSKSLLLKSSTTLFGKWPC